MIKMRLIDADSVIKTIAGMQKAYPITDRRQRAIGIRVALFDCRNLIENQPTISQWIPVSERLPQASKHILFSVKGKSYASYGFYNDGIWTDINGAWYTDKEVNAWMPLPEPYKEGSNNE